MVHDTVYCLYTIECVQVAIASHDANKVLGEGWGDTDELFKTHYFWITSPLTTGIGECPPDGSNHGVASPLRHPFAVSTTVQFYFSWRIYVLSGSALLSLVICLVGFLIQTCRSPCLINTYPLDCAGTGICSCSQRNFSAYTMSLSHRS